MRPRGVWPRGRELHAHAALTTANTALTANATPALGAAAQAADSDLTSTFSTWLHHLHLRLIHNARVDDAQRCWHVCIHTSRRFNVWVLRLGQPAVWARFGARRRGLLHQHPQGQQLAGRRVHAVVRRVSLHSAARLHREPRFSVPHDGKHAESHECGGGGPVEQEWFQKCDIMAAGQRACGGGVIPF